MCLFYIHVCVCCGKGAAASRSWTFESAPERRKNNCLNNTQFGLKSLDTVLSLFHMAKLEKIGIWFFNN